MFPQVLCDYNENKQWIKELTVSISIEICVFLTYSFSPLYISKSCIPELESFLCAFSYVTIDNLIILKYAFFLPPLVDYIFNTL